MNAAYVAIGGALVAIGAAALARSRTSEDATRGKNKRVAGILLTLAGAIFMGTGVVVGSPS